MNATCLHIINLPHRSDRLELLNKELSVQKITNTKIWTGVLDQDVPFRGVSKAQKQIIAWAKGRKQKEVLIAEDDIQFSAPGAFDYFKMRKPVDFDIYLGGITWGSIREDHTVIDFSGATLYIAHEKFYDIILNLPNNADYDRAMNGLGKFVVCDPMIVYQHSGYRDNQRRNVDFDPLIRRMKWFRQ